MVDRAVKMSSTVLHKYSCGHVLQEFKGHGGGGMTRVCDTSYRKEAVMYLKLTRTVV